MHNDTRLQNYKDKHNNNNSYTYLKVINLPVRRSNIFYSLNWKAMTQSFVLKMLEIDLTLLKLKVTDTISSHASLSTSDIHNTKKLAVHVGHE